MRETIAPAHERTCSVVLLLKHSSAVPKSSKFLRLITLVMVYVLSATLVLGFAIIFVFRILAVLPKKFSVAKLTKTRENGCKLMVVLGSGGHTTEMLKEIEGIDFNVFSFRHYVVASNDALSQSMLQFWEEKALKKGNFAVSLIQRSRKVGQSYCSSLLTTIYGCFQALKLLYLHKPQLLLCNGPGTCVPLVVSAFSLKVAGFKAPKIVYIESFARVKSLSLAGRLVYPLVDRFFFQWPVPPRLQEKYQRIEYHGRFI